METAAKVAHREPWNNGKFVGRKGPVQAQGHLGALNALSNREPSARAGTLQLGTRQQAQGLDICRGNQVASRAVVMQRKTQRPMQFEITPVTRDALQNG